MFKIQTSQNELESIFSMVKYSSYVINNFEYDEKASNTKIVYAEDDISINAHASSHKYPNHEIVIYQGLNNSSKLLGIALANYDFIKQNYEKKALNMIRDVCNYVGVTARNTGSFTSDNVTECFNTHKLIINPTLFTESYSYWFGAILGVVGHELGHICLSHTVRGDWSNEVSRNDERQADLFANSIVATTPYSKYNILATLFTEIIFTWMSGTDDTPATTHPHSRERVYNTLNSHYDILEGYGFTHKTIEYFLPT